ncbi:MAG: thioredoxin [Lysobacteraceae bacterium]|nr:MAG: thioredoxin [Xanthomonadaceae bacterium]
MNTERPHRRWAGPALILVLALAGAWAGLWAGRVLSPNPSVPPGAGGMAPDLVVHGLDGTRRPLSAWRGEPVLVNYWATWCAPCVEELPRLEALHTAGEGERIEVIAIAREDDPVAVQAFLARLVPALPGYIEPLAENSPRRFGTERDVLPFSVLIAADGRILDRKAGILRERDLRQWVEMARDSAR